MNYMYLCVDMLLLRTETCKLIGRRYFIIGHLAQSPAEIVRLAGLLRGTESASQAVSVCFCH